MKITIDTTVGRIFSDTTLTLDDIDLAVILLDFAHGQVETIESRNRFLKNKTDKIADWDKFVDDYKKSNL